VLPGLDLRNVRLWQGQWHLPPGCSHVEIAGKQHHEACGMANAPGYAPGILSGPPE
jgi:hypothetical protein